MLKTFLSFFNFFLLSLMLSKEPSLEPKLQMSSLLLDASLSSRDWSNSSDLEISIFSKVSSSCLRFFLPLKAYFSFFSIRMFTLCLVYVFSPPFLNPLDLLDLSFLIRALNVVHSSVEWLHFPWYWQNFFLLEGFLSSDESSSESSKETALHFLEFFFFSFSWLDFL